MRSILRKPSVVVAAWAVLVLGLFAWRGDLRLEARSPDGAQVASKGSAARSGEAVVVRRKESGRSRLPRASRDGRVFDSMGFLLVGAEVVPDEGTALRSDADGRFSIELPEHRTSDLLVRAEGRRGVWRRTTARCPDPLVVRLVPEAPWDAAPTPLQPAPRLRGEGIVRGVDGEPLAGAFVNVRGSDCWSRTDEFGRYELPLPSTSARFEVFHTGAAEGGGFAAMSRSFVSPRARGIVPLPEMTVEPAGSIHGTVRDARGVPIAGLPVEVRGDGATRRVETGPGGAFVLRGLRAGDYEVEPFAHRGAIAAPISVRVDREVVPCDIGMQRVEPKNVRVVHEGGAVAAGVWVATRLYGLRRAVGQADENGELSLPVLADSGFDVRTDDGFARCEVRRFDAASQPATIVVAQP